MREISKMIILMAMEERSFLMVNTTKVISKKAKQVVMASFRTYLVENTKAPGWMTNSMALEKKYGIMEQKLMKESS